MALTDRHKGYLSNTRRDNPSQYKKFQRICHDNETTPNQQFGKLVRAVANHGFVNLDELASGQVKKKQEIKQLGENASLVGAVNMLCESLMANKVQDVQQQQHQLNKMVMEPLQGDITQLQQMKLDLSTQLEQMTADIAVIDAERKRLAKSAQAEKAAVLEAQQDLMQVRAKTQQEQQKQIVASALPPKDVPKGKDAGRPLH